MDPSLAPLASGTNTESRGWIDQRNDGETGLTYLHARYFDPKLGLFLSPDPLDPTLPGVGLNRYSYGFGNPILGADRSGQRVARSGEEETCTPDDNCWYHDDQGTATFSPTMVVINPTGLFMNPPPMGAVRLPSGSTRWVGNGSQYGAFISLHERGHQTQVFPVDAPVPETGLTVSQATERNAANSLAVIDACY